MGIRWIITFFKWLNWHTSGKPYIEYPGFHCGCCGKWIKKKHKIRKYKSRGRWADTWDLCDECASAGIDLSNDKPKRADPLIEIDTVKCANGSYMITARPKLTPKGKDLSYDAEPGDEFGRSVPYDLEPGEEP
jgi:hypothetical protein